MFLVSYVSIVHMIALPYVKDPLARSSDARRVNEGREEEKKNDVSDCY